MVSKMTIRNHARALNFINITSSLFTYNANGCLKFVLKTAADKSHIWLEDVTITGNKGAFSNDLSIVSSSIGQGTGILFYCACIGYSSSCNNNISGNSGHRSMVHFVDDTGNELSLLNVTQVTIILLNFTTE